MFKTIIELIIAIPKIIAMIVQLISWVNAHKKEAEQKRRLEEAQKKYDEAISKEAGDADLAKAAEDLLNGGKK